MTRQDDKRGLFGWFGERSNARQRALDELKALDKAAPVDIERMAAGVGMSVDELSDIIARGERASELVRRMMEAHGLDRNRLAIAQPLLVAEIEDRCATCEHRHRCEVELNARTAAEHADAFCVNAPVMRALVQAAEPSA